MPFTEAARVLAPGSAHNGYLLRIVLANLDRGLDRGDIAARVCRDKLLKAANDFLSGGNLTEDALLNKLVGVLESDNDGWYERLPDLASFLDQPMAAMTDHRGIAAWMNELGSLAYKDLPDLLDACNELNALLADPTSTDLRLDISVGRPGRPLWLTPFTNDLAGIVRLAESNPSSIHANRIIGHLGLSHVEPGFPVIAAITTDDASALLAEPTRLAGPTGLEAGGFKHFRHWPQIGDSDGFGRTYELNRKVRASAKPRQDFGLPEAVRHPLTLRRLKRLVYIGHVEVDTNLDMEVDNDFCAAIGADITTARLLGSITTRLAGA